MPKWFMPLAAVNALMFAASPFLIANADYEATMGLVQKIFYSCSRRLSAGSRAPDTCFAARPARIASHMRPLS